MWCFCSILNVRGELSRPWLRSSGTAEETTKTKEDIIKIRSRRLKKESKLNKLVLVRWCLSWSSTKTTETKLVTYTHCHLTDFFSTRKEHLPIIPGVSEQLWSFWDDDHDDDDGRDHGHLQLSVSAEPGCYPCFLQHCGPNPFFLLLLLLFLFLTTYEALLQRYEPYCGRFHCSLKALS